MKCEVIYFELPNGKVPVREFIDGLELKARNKVFRVLSHITEFGLVSVIPHIKKLTGTPLWEIRVLGKDNVRILFVSIVGNKVILLHGFVKKTQKTPVVDVEISLKRFSSLDL